MTIRIPLRCRCGTVRGSLAGVSPEAKKRAVCYCDDCQIYAEHLGRHDILDEHGGTEAVMSAPAWLTLTEGASEVRCVRLSPKGLHRWYAACCNTPLGNTVSPRLPVVIVPTACLDFAALGQSADQALGLPATRMFARFARGGVPAGAHPKTPIGLLPSLVMHLLTGFLKGRAQPSPFYDANGQPCTPAQLVDKGEREAWRAVVQKAAGLA